MTYAVKHQRLSIEAKEVAQLIKSGAAFIDVRSEKEFAKGSLPGAYNAPILNNSEREQVGICYKNEGRDAAARLGHQLVQGDTRAERIAHWVRLVKAHDIKALFCWRGGLRSQITADWLAEAGLSLPTVSKGYKAVRAELLDTLDYQPARLRFYLIGGQTGVGKTDLVVRVKAHINLEALAHHRGSAFGGYADGQPTTIQFEHYLAKALLQQSSVTVLEDEGRHIGRLRIPDALYQAMQKADLIVLEASLEQRVDRIFQSYIIEGLRDYQTQPDGEAAFFTSLSDALFRIRKRLGGVHYKRLNNRMQAAFDGQSQRGRLDGHRDWIEDLLQHYYDPMYTYQLEQKADRIRFRGEAEAVLDYLQSKAGPHLYK